MRLLSSSQEELGSAYCINTHSITVLLEDAFAQRFCENVCSHFVSVAVNHFDSLLLHVVLDCKVAGRDMFSSGSDSTFVGHDGNSGLIILVDDNWSSQIMPVGW